MRDIIHNCLGTFGWKFLGRQHYGKLYSLNQFDASEYIHHQLKEGEQLFRYTTDTSLIGGYMPVIKINTKSRLAYFQTEASFNGDTGLSFETRGLKLIHFPHIN